MIRCRCAPAVLPHPTGGAADDDRQAPDRYGAGEQKIHCRERGAAVVRSRGECRHDDKRCVAACLTADNSRRDGTAADDGGSCGRGRAHSLPVHDRRRAHERPVVARCEKNAAHADLRKAAAPWRVLFRAGLHGGGRAGRSRGRGSARDVFRRLSAAVFLRHARTADALCRTVFCQYAGCVCAARVRSADPGRHCGGADVGKKAPVALLGAVYKARRYLSGESAGVDHAENLSGGWTAQRRHE